MKLLLDHCVPATFKRHIVGHDVSTTREMGWETLKNGALMSKAANAGFEVLITVDQNLRHQQNLSHLPLAVVVIVVHRNTLAHLIPCVDALLAAVNGISAGKLVEVSAPA